MIKIGTIWINPEHISCVTSTEDCIIININGSSQIFKFSTFGVNNKTEADKYFDKLFKKLEKQKKQDEDTALLKYLMAFKNLQQ
jgi:uncharacterized protein YlzI (FlbEa/FlbD family)